MNAPLVSIAPSRFPSIDVDALAACLHENAELALVDVREEGGIAGDGHIIFSVPLPLSRLELRAGSLLKRRAVPIVVTDSGPGDLAARAAAKLAELGFVDVSLLSGGVAAWAASGREVYTGSGAYSKAFGEFVEHAYGTPHISAEEFKGRVDAGERIVVLDGRTLQEFENFSVPGAHAVPNAELPLRAHDLITSPDDLVVVNCAGRTRSIIGAQALINAGLPNKVVALENGTMAWLANGWSLEHGRQAELQPPSNAALAQAKAAVAQLSHRFALSWIDEAALDRFRSEAEQRSLYVYDVRSKAEFEAGHLPDAHWAEGGQLVQGVDRWVGARNARIVVVDDEVGVRAAITASWLVQLGWGEVHALAVWQTGEGRLAGPDRPPLLRAPPSVETIAPAALKHELDAGAVTVIDLDTSLAYASGHIPGARFAVRARLDVSRDIEGGSAIVLTSADGILAAFAAAELAPRTGRSVRVLAGGTQAWRAAGLPLETGETALIHDADDVWRSPYQKSGDRLAAFKAYLDWEIGLLAQIERDPDLSFKVFP
ncbi:MULTISPECIES: rhodanese-like domain-containing protein [unclassified Bradyrhizobium]|uniref:rhodanese-like domain-containing protein n=1 Tax=unclassified Bradyrhizobium TaxID=2631580 RepID=UPI0028E6DA9D|nr:MULTISPECIES: rhodanese-like domain-containing protein [unclassified Bradyrhizobium]